MSLSEALSARRSFSQSTFDRPLTLSEWGTLLGNALGPQDRLGNRAYPSGGSLFPIETYIVGEALENQGPGVIHYHPTDHKLEQLWDVPDFAMTRIIKSPDVPLSSILIVFTSSWNYSARKYGTFAYYLSMLEAGHMAQNILLAATAMHFSGRPVGDFDDDMLHKMLDLNDIDEQAVYCILLSPSKKQDNAK